MAEDNKKDLRPRRVGKTLQTTTLKFDKNHQQVNHVVVTLKAEAEWRMSSLDKEGRPGKPRAMEPGTYVLDFTTNSHSLSSLSVSVIDPDPGVKR